MSLYDLLDLIASQRELVFNTWNMFVAVHITIIGGLFLISREVSLIERLVAYALYLVFLCMNWNAQIVNYEYINLLVLEAQALEAKVGCGAAVCLAKQAPSSTSAQSLVHVVYGLGAIVTFLTVMLINKMSHRADAAKSDSSSAETAPR